jgi:predicted negative regulator of RcsB-dependent stress response
MTRHELKEKDGVTSSLQRFIEIVYDRQKEILAGAAVLVVIVLAIIGWSFYSASRNASAQAQLALAINAFNDMTLPDKERHERTLAEAQKTYDEYSSTPAGAIAQYYMALSFEGLGDTPKALQTLEEVAQRGDDEIRGVARFAMAAIHRQHGEAGKAIDIYKQLYDNGGYSKAAAAYELATAYEGNNQLDQAKEYYQKVVSEFADSPFRQDADEALKRLGVSAQPPAEQKPS